MEHETVQQPLEGTGTMGQARFPGPYNNDFLEDRQENLEETQDIIDAEDE